MLGFGQYGSGWYDQASMGLASVESLMIVDAVTLLLAFPQSVCLVSCLSRLSGDGGEVSRCADQSM